MTPYCKNIVEVQVVYDPKKTISKAFVYLFVLLGGIITVWITITIIYYEILALECIYNK